MTIYEFADWRASREFMTPEEFADAYAAARAEDEERRKPREKGKGLSLMYIVPYED